MSPCFEVRATGLRASSLLATAMMTLAWSVVLPSLSDVARGATYLVTVNDDGSLSPDHLELFSGDAVEWRFPDRSRSIIPVELTPDGQRDCVHPRPYIASDPNEFTGPMPRGASGVFTLGPEEAPYASQSETWSSPQFTGVFIRPRWDDVHLGPGRFDWSQIDAEIDQAVRNRKLYSIGFKAGVKGTPQWIFDPNKTETVVQKLDFGLRSNGRPAYYGSPADEHFRAHFFDLLRAFAAHLRSNNARYRALAYVKISGLNLYTHENRLPNETTEDLATWAGAGRYTPNALLQFYHDQTELLAAEFPDKDMSYALIQDGFPRVNNLGEYLGQPKAPAQPIPSGSSQTEAVLDQGRTEYGLRFVVQHNGLQEKPQFCPGSGDHPIQVSPSFHYVGSGCPNRWVLAEAERGQITGYQDVAGIGSLSQLDSTFFNAWDNSDGVFMEIYEGIALQAAARGLPSGMTVSQWAERLHDRRRSLFPTVPDPFPTAHRHTFLRTADAGARQLLHYVTRADCLSDSPQLVGQIEILPDLSFAAITREAGDSIGLTLKVAQPGTLRIDASSNLRDWAVLTTVGVTSREVKVSDAGPVTSRRFYRATWTTP